MRRVLTTIVALVSVSPLLACSPADGTASDWLASDEAAAIFIQWTSTGDELVGSVSLTRLTGTEW